MESFENAEFFFHFFTIPPKKMKSFQEIFFKFKFSMEILEQLTEFHLKSIPLRLETFLARLGSLKNLLNFGEFLVFKAAKRFIIFFQNFHLIFQIYACTLNYNIYFFFIFRLPFRPQPESIDKIFGKSLHWPYAQSINYQIYHKFNVHKITKTIFN